MVYQPVKELFVTLLNGRCDSKQFNSAFFCMYEHTVNIVEYERNSRDA